MLFMLKHHATTDICTCDLQRKPARMSQGPQIPPFADLANTQINPQKVERTFLKPLRLVFCDKRGIMNAIEASLYKWSNVGY